MTPRHLARLMSLRNPSVDRIIDLCTLTTVLTVRYQSLICHGLRTCVLQFCLQLPVHVNLYQHPCRYDNMQKVGPQDVPVDGVSDHISVGGVNSEPLSIKQGNAMVRDPAAHLMQYVPSRAWCVAQAAMWGATTGAMLGTAVALVPAWWDRERWGKQLAAQVAHNAWWGALTGGVASAVSVVSGSTVAGSVAAGAVGVWEAVRGAQDRTEAVREAVVLSTSFAAGLGAATLCTTVLGPAAFLAGPAAAWYASDYVRCTVKGHNPSLYQLAAWGLRARAAVQR